MFASWWVVPSPKPSASIRLLCLPYAGASATAFHKLALRMPADVETCSLQLPGRGFRMRETALESFDALLDAIVQVIEPKLDKPYALFGHSMGGLVAFEVARRMRASAKRMPSALVVSASPAPEAMRTHLVSLDLASPALWEAVNALYGLPPRAMDPELIAMAVPPLRADLSALATYRYESQAPLDVPIRALAGTNDPMVSLADAEKWRVHTTAGFASHAIPGAHLYVQDSPDALVAVVASLVGRIARAPS